MVGVLDKHRNDRFGLALLLATVVHALLILGMTFDFQQSHPAERRQPNLEILVVHNPRPPQETPQPDFLAQTSQQGGGNQDDKARPLAPEPPLADAAPPLPEPPASPPASAPLPSPPTKTVVAAQRPEAPATPQPRRHAKPAQKPLPSLSQLLASSRQEADRLSAELSRKRELYAKRPRRKHISASTQEYQYAAYLEAWRRKVERIGNLNYPDEAKRRKLYGNLVLSVALRPDGSVEDIRLTRSSGQALLDDAAIRIVRLAAPYAPFPKEIREETDILEITRTWQFLSDNQLFSGN
jgi:protein TonB